MRTVQKALLRILDANANRVLEGLRVCEEVVRFYWVSPRLFRQVRDLRHAVRRAITQLPWTAADLAQERDSQQDVGRAIEASSVSSLERLLIINLQRSKEALRVLEECTRLVAPRQSSGFGRLRFRTYEVERALLLRMAALRHR